MFYKRILLSIVCLAISFTTICSNFFTKNYSEQPTNPYALCRSLHVLIQNTDPQHIDCPVTIEMLKEKLEKLPENFNLNNDLTQFGFGENGKYGIWPWLYAQKNTCEHATFFALIKLFLHSPHAPLNDLIGQTFITPLLYFMNALCTTQDPFSHTIAFNIITLFLNKTSSKNPLNIMAPATIEGITYLEFAATHALPWLIQDLINKDALHHDKNPYDHSLLFKTIQAWQKLLVQLPNHKASIFEKSQDFLAIVTNLIDYHEQIFETEHETLKMVAQYMDYILAHEFSSPNLKNYPSIPYRIIHLINRIEANGILKNPTE
jgi:hypothetical protein